VDGRYLCDKLAQFKDNNGSENCCLRCWWKFNELYIVLINAYDENESSDKIYVVINIMTKLQSFLNLFKRFSFNLFWEIFWVSGTETGMSKKLLNRDFIRTFNDFWEKYQKIQVFKELTYTCACMRNMQKISHICRHAHACYCTWIIFSFTLKKLKICLIQWL
jgi:hypothetical protein